MKTPKIIIAKDRDYRYSWFVWLPPIYSPLWGYHAFSSFDKAVGFVRGVLDS